MISKQQAIEQIVALTDAHKISLEELSSALGRQQIDSNKKDPFNITRLFSYIGGILILFGLIAYTNAMWSNLNSVARVIITFGTGLASILLAVIAASQNKPEKIVTILVGISALFQAGGLFVFMKEFSSGNHNLPLAALLIFGVLALQYGALFSKLKRTSMLFFAIYFGILCFVSGAELVAMPHKLTELICGLSILALSYGINRTRYNSICAFGYSLSSIILLWMSFDILKGSSFEFIYLGIAAFMIYVSTIVRSRSMLASSAIAMFSYLSYFTATYFANSIGWPICLILLGIIFFGMGAVVLKVSKRLVG